MLDAFQTILVLAPHTDDGELGCGGLIARAIEEGKNVHYAAFSIAEESVPEGLPDDILAKEVRQAVEVLGISADNLYVHKFPVRRFPQYRQEILEELVGLRRQLEPDLVLMPALSDVHQDHQTIAQEAVRAFRMTSLWGYEMPWNNLGFSADCAVHLEERHVRQKAEALKCYKSQNHRRYCDPQFLESWARTRGVQNGADFAEVFEVCKLMVR